MKFSIVITSYNQPEYLNEALQSIHRQTYNEKFQLIVVDDSAPQKVFAFYIPMKENIEFNIIYNHKNLGLQCSYNLGCYYAKGDYILRCDGDDKFLPNTLQDLSDFIDEQTDPKIAFFYSDLKVMGSEKVKIYPDWNQTLLGTQNIGHLQAVKRVVSEQLNHWDVSLKYSADTDFIIRVIEAGFKLKHIPKVLYENRLHSEQYTQKFPQEGGDINYWKNKIFSRTMQQRPELWPESYQNVVLQTTGSYYWKSEALAVQKYCIGNGLDLGCSSRKKSPFTIGVDISRIGGKVPELVWNIQDELPFRSQTLDYILSCHSIEHLERPEIAIIQWLKKIKRGGYLILVVPDKRYIPNIGTKDGDPSHLHDWAPKDFEKEVLNKVIDVMGTRMLLQIIENREIGNKWSFIVVIKRG